MSIFAVIILWMSVVPLTIGAYDDRHRDRIECNVTDPKGEDDNPLGRRSWSTPEVKISTSDCGSLLFVPGPGDAAYGAIAEELAEGGRFSFEMGQATRALQGAINAIGMTPEVLSYQKID